MTSKYFGVALVRKTFNRIANLPEKIRTSNKSARVADAHVLTTQCENI